MCGGRLVLQTIRKQFLGNLLGRAFPPHQKVPVFGTSQYYCCRQFETISWESPSLAYKHRDPPWVQKKWNKDTSSKQIVAKETKTHRVDVFEIFSPSVKDFSNTSDHLNFLSRSDPIFPGHEIHLYWSDIPLWNWDFWFEDVSNEAAQAGIADEKEVWMGFLGNYLEIPLPGKWMDKVVDEVISEKWMHVLFWLKDAKLMLLQSLAAASVQARVYQNAWKSKFQGGGLPNYVVPPN